MRLADFIVSLSTSARRLAEYRADPVAALDEAGVDPREGAVLRSGAWPAICTALAAAARLARRSAGHPAVAPKDAPAEPDEQPARGPASLSFVGIGLHSAAQLTPEAKHRIEEADTVFHLGLDPLARHIVEALAPEAQSLSGCFAESLSRQESYRRAIRRLLAEVRGGLEVCVVLYGHPGIFVGFSHQALRSVRDEGYEASMLPAISAEDCLFADLGIDPAVHGRRSFEATDFLLRPRPADTTTGLVLWQIGAIGVTVSKKKALWSRPGLELLVRALLEDYPAAHSVTLYEAAMAPVCEPRIVELALDRLASADVTVASTLWIPPLRPAAVDPTRAAELGLDTGPRRAGDDG